MELFKGIALFIGWLTGSFAGIGAILYACGYLVTRARLRTLGLFGLFEHSPDYYLQEGANFVVNLSVIVIGPIIPQLVGIGIFLIVLVILSVPLVIYLFKKRERIVRFVRKAHVAAAELIKSHPWLWRNAVLLTLFFLLIFHLLFYFNDFTPVLTVKNLLYIGDPKGQIDCWILTDQHIRLNEHFRRLLRADAEAGLALALAWQVTLTSRLRIWITLPFIVLFIMYTLFLPLAYGALMRTTRPVVTLTLENRAVVDTKERLFLLNKTEHEFVLWDSQGKRVIWIPDEEVEAAEVKETQLLFATGQGGSCSTRESTP